MKPLRDVRDAIETWLRSIDFNTAPDIVPGQGWVSAFVCNHHQNLGVGDSGLTSATCTVKVYVSRADLGDAQRKADDAQTTLHEALEGFVGPWYDLTVSSSSVAEEASGDTRYLVVSLQLTVYV